MVLVGGVNVTEICNVMQCACLFELRTCSSAEKVISFYEVLSDGMDLWKPSCIRCNSAHVWTGQWCDGFLLVHMYM